MTYRAATPILKIEFLVGSSIEAACAEAVLLASKLDVLVTFNFNGTEVMARRLDDPARLAAEFIRVCSMPGAIAADPGAQ